MSEETEAAAKPERFWFGAIQTRRHAEKIIRRNGWTFVALAALFLIALARQSSGQMAGLVLVFAAPALALIWLKDAVLAFILLVLCGFGAAGGAMALMREAPVGEARATGRLLPFVVWSVLAYVAWRAFVAARHLRCFRAPRG